MWLYCNGNTQNNARDTREPREWTRLAPSWHAFVKQPSPLQSTQTTACTTVQKLCDAHPQVSIVPSISVHPKYSERGCWSKILLLARWNKNAPVLSQTLNTTTTIAQWMAISRQMSWQRAFHCVCVVEKYILLQNIVCFLQFYGNNIFSVVAVHLFYETLPVYVVN